MATDGATTALALPSVMKAPIRPDIVNHTHANMAKNRRQPYAVSKKTGHQTSAESWGTGRAVSRIPRVPGGGTHRAGQGAFGNMCRGGRMFAPTKIWRRWHNKITVNLKIYAIASAIAAPLPSPPSSWLAATASILFPRFPLLLAIPLKASRRPPLPSKPLSRSALILMLRRPRTATRFVLGSKLVKAFRNVPGVEVINVERLNLLKLAPGGHLGRFVVWTKSAFEKLDSIYGSFDKPSEKKKGYLLPRAKMVNADVPRIINSDELNPYAKTARRMALLAEEQRVKAKKEKLDKKRKQISKEAATTIKPSGKVWYQTMISDSNYTEFENFTKWLGVSQ
ncbi:ribosomal protein L4/L1 family [Actinidia rufa]|uniref:Ribosomal protein L4/L1 family n=1 Tax=Actinidia rufa TaxID=165716 RepID=A0A7J0DUA9_9ERIC|nr:ribosomal protein L4/L1 family [Actinidia rufa]